MSGGFHVHGPHDHAIEHATQNHQTEKHEDSGFSGRIAVVTAVLATVGAIFAYQGGATQAYAMLYKHDAAIKKTEAANHWSLYQSKSSKQNLAELAIELVPAKQSFYEAEIKRYDQEKTKIKAEADVLEAQAKHFEDLSDAELHTHHRWTQATTVLQIAIALSAIALITRRRWLVNGVYGISLVGIVLGFMAFTHI